MSNKADAMFLFYRHCRHKQHCLNLYSIQMPSFLLLQLLFQKETPSISVFPFVIPSSIMATPKMAPASLSLDERKVALSLDEAKTDFLHIIAKLKPSHVSKFFQWLELHINAYKLNGFVLHGKFCLQDCGWMNEWCP